MTDDDADADAGESYEYDGRAIHVDTGYYEVKVWGEPDDDFGKVLEAVEQAADRASEDVRELEDNGNGGEYA